MSFWKWSGIPADRFEDARLRGGPRPTRCACHTPPVRQRSPSLWCGVLCAAALLLAWMLAVVVPPGLPYDEPAHHDNVAFYAAEGRLPVLGQPGVEYEAQMGPVYYVIGALLLRLTGTGDAPFAALEVLRLAGLALVPVLGWLTYRLARDLGARDGSAALASGLLVLNPTLLAVAASAQNDYLCLVLAAVAALVALPALRRGGTRRSLVVGALVGLAVLVKVFAGALLVGFVVAVLLDRRRSLRPRVLDAVAAAVGTAVVSGWWFVRNLVLYGDLTGAAAVELTGVSFDPLAYEGIGSVLGWGRSLVSYAFAPTEYYRNAIEAPLAVKAAAGLLTVAFIVLVAALLVQWAKGDRSSDPDTAVVFALTSVLTVVLVYAAAAWTMQAIAPRLVAVAAPLALALVARAARPRTQQLALLAVLLGCAVLDVWLVVSVATVSADSAPFPW